MHLSQVWARKARDSGMVRPERPCLLHTQASPGATALLTAVHDPRSPCEGSPWAVVPRYPARDPPGDACRRTGGRRESSFSTGISPPGEIAVHFSQVRVRKLRNRGMASPESRCLIDNEACAGVQPR